MQVRSIRRRDDPTDRGFGAFDFSFSASASASVDAGGGAADDPSTKSTTSVSVATPTGVVGGSARGAADWGLVFDLVVDDWRAYAAALGRTPAPGVDDFAAAIDAASAQIAALNAARASDQAAFQSAVGAFFGDTGRGFFGKLFSIAASFGRDASYDPSLLDDARSCAGALSAEGWPLWPVISTNRPGGSGTFLSVKTLYCDRLAGWRSLTPVRATSIRALWRNMVANSGDPDVAFLLRFARTPIPGGGVTIDDDNPPGFRLSDVSTTEGAYASTTAAKWCVLCSTVAARARNVSPREVALRTLPVVFSTLARLSEGTYGSGNHYYESPPVAGLRGVDVAADTAQLAFNVSREVASGGKATVSPSHMALAAATPKARTTSGAVVIAASAGAGVLGYGLFRIVRALADARRLTTRKDR